MENSLPFSGKPIISQVNLQGSKSISNRVLLMAALAKGDSQISNIPLNKDVLACLETLKSLGVKCVLDKKKRVIQINGCNGVLPRNSATIFCNESGTLTRFITPICAAQKDGRFYIYAAPRMMERPMSDQLKVLEDMGMNAIYEKKILALPLTIRSGGLNSKNISINGNKTSQFLSGLLLSAPLIQNGLVINSLENSSQNYVKMTTYLMGLFGVFVTHENNSYKVPQCSYVARNYFIEPDISTASYFWALAALTNGKVRINNVYIDSCQGDIYFLKILRNMGCSVNIDNDGIEVVGNKEIKGVTVNMRECSDTFMTVAALAVFASSDTFINGLSHTRFQESNRLKAMNDGLQRIGVYTEITEDSILISPSRSSLKSNSVNSFNDHRIAMSLSLIGLRTRHNILVKDSECVSKTCPDFFERIYYILEC